MDSRVDLLACLICISGFSSSCSFLSVSESSGNRIEEVTRRPVHSNARPRKNFYHQLSRIATVKFQYPSPNPLDTDSLISASSQCFNTPTRYNHFRRATYCFDLVQYDWRGRLTIVNQRLHASRLLDCLHQGRPPKLPFIRR